MGDNSTFGARDASAKEAIDVFVHQPALHADEDTPRTEGSPAPRVRTGWRKGVINFLFNKKPSAYSSLAPRDSQGGRSKPFFFNGNGRGR
jgi:hypothetical protein